MVQSILHARREGYDYSGSTLHKSQNLRTSSKRTGYRIRYVPTGRAHDLGQARSEVVIYKGRI